MYVCRKDLQTSFWWMNSLLVWNSCEFSLVRHLHFFSKTQSTLTQMLAMQSSFINVDWVHMWCWTVICIYSLNLMFSCMILWQVHPYPELTATTFCIINHGTTNIDTPGIQLSCYYTSWICCSLAWFLFLQTSITSLNFGSLVCDGQSLVETGISLGTEMIK